MWLWLAVAALGGAGALLRVGLDALVSRAAPHAFPLGTLAVNLTGTVALGVLAGSSLGADAYLLEGTALIGSYTTFSTWMLESQRLAEDGARWLPLLNLALGLALGLGAAALGRALA